MTITKNSTARLPASALLLLAILAFGGSPAEAKSAKKSRVVAKGKHQGTITGLASKEKGATTTLRIAGNTTPTFTVYKLQNPSRVVVDIVGAQLDPTLRRRDEKAVWSINSWAVGQVSAHHMGKGRGLVRVVVGLSRKSRYSVRAVGNNVVVEVTANEKPQVSTRPDLLQARNESAAARAAAEREITLAKAEAAQIRAQARKSNAEASKKISEAKRLVAQAKKMSEEARLESRVVAGEIAEAKRREASARSAEAAALARKTELRKAESAAQLALSKAQAARLRNTKDSAALHRKAESAARAAEARRGRAEKAMAVANAERLLAEKASANANANRLAAAHAVTQANAERKRAEGQRDQAIATRKSADQSRKRAQQTAERASARAQELKTLVQAEEQRFEAARKLRTREELAVAKAVKAKRIAEEQQRFATAAQSKLNAELRTLALAKRKAKQQTTKAKQALQASRVAAADGKISAGERARLQKKADRLALEGKQAEKLLLRKERALESQRAEVAALNSKREKAAKGLSSLEREAKLAQKRRRSEEKKLAGLAAKRSSMRVSLDEASAMRVAAQQELRRARMARKEAETARNKAESARLAAESARSDADSARSEALATAKRAQDELNKAKLAHQAAERARATTATQLEAQLQRSKQAQLAAEQDRALSASQVARKLKTVRRELSKAKRAHALAEKEREETAKKMAVELRRAKKAKLAAEKERLANAKRLDQELRLAKASNLAAEKERLANAKRLDQELRLAKKAKLAAEKERLANAKRLDQELRLAKAANLAAEKDRAASASKVRSELARATSERLAAERERVAVTSQIQAELEKAKLARMAAEKDRAITAREILKAKEREAEARATLQTSQHARQLAKSKESRAAVAKAVAQTRSAQRALKKAEAERAQAVRARREGEKALRLANLRENEAKAKLVASHAKRATKASAPIYKTRLREIDVVEKQDVSRIVIALSAPATPVVISNRGGQAVLEIPAAAMRNDQERTLDTTQLGGTIRAVSSYRNPKKPGTIKVVVDLKGKSKGVLKKVGNTYYWDFPHKRTTVAVAKKAKSRVASYKPQAVAGYGSASSPVTQQTVAQLSKRRRKTYRGRKIDLNFKRHDIHDLMRLLATVGGVNIIVPDNISARVTIRLTRVPWDQALDVILASKGLGFKMEGPRLYRIATRKELDAEFESKMNRARALADSEPPTPEIFNLNYVQADAVQAQISSLLSVKGSIQVDKRTNALIINDVAANRARIVNLLTQLDTQTPQVQIEARIVEARSTFIRQFGIQWGGNIDASAAGGNATGLIFPSSIGLAGAADDGQTPNGGVAANPSNFAVNLPAAIGTGSGGGIGLSLGSVGGNLGLNLRLSALEDEGTVRIVSSPKITTSNNIEATIKSGVSIPISVVSANGVQTTFVPADLELKVTPSVSLRDCAVSMQIQVKKNEADFVNTGARGDPTLLTKEAKTTILVQDGDTSVIGGIYTRNSGVSYSKVPFFGDLPVIGWLFKTTRENDERTEVLIFITPKITNRAFLPCGE